VVLRNPLLIYVITSLLQIIFVYQSHIFQHISNQSNHFHAFSIQIFPFHIHFHQIIHFISERELTFRTVYVVDRPSVCRLSVTFVRSTRAIDIFGNVSTPFGTLAICWYPDKILWRSSQRNPSSGELNIEG